MFSKKYSNCLENLNLAQTTAVSENITVCVCDNRLITFVGNHETTLGDEPEIEIKITKINRNQDNELLKKRLFELAQIALNDAILSK